MHIKNPDRLNNYFLRSDEIAKSEDEIVVRILKMKRNGVHIGVVGIQG